MKTSTLPFLLLLCIGLLGWSSCGDDDDTVADSLNYDGGNFTAPFNDAGQHTFAAYFPPGETQAFSGRDIERVSFWMEEIPGATSVVIFAEGADDSAPSTTELYRSLDLSQRIRNRGWQDHFLTTPITLNANEGIWIAVEVDIPSDRFQAIGCDQGLNFNPNGDRYQIPQGPTWTNFEDFTGSERINWNIRGFLAEE